MSCGGKIDVNNRYTDIPRGFYSGPVITTATLASTDKVIITASETLGTTTVDTTNATMVSGGITLGKDTKSGTYTFAKGIGTVPGVPDHGNTSPAAGDGAGVTLGAANSIAPGHTLTIAGDAGIAQAVAANGTLTITSDTVAVTRTVTVGANGQTIVPAAVRAKCRLCCHHKTQV